MKNLFTTLLIAMSLVGCATQNVTTDNYAGTSHFEYTFAKDDVNRGPVTQEEASKAVRQALLTRTRFRFVQDWVTSLYKFSGLYTIEHTPQSFTASYSHGENYSHQQNGFSLSPNQSAILYDLNVQIQDAGAGTVHTAVEVSPQVRISVGHDPLGLPYSQIIKQPQASADIERILSHKDWIIVNRTYALENEVDSQYDAASVLGNFTRALHPYSMPNVNHDRLEDNHSFQYPFQGKLLILQVSTMAYHGGTKIKYQISIPYGLSGDGRTSITPDDVQKVKADIDRIALQ